MKPGVAIHTRARAPTRLTLSLSFSLSPAYRLAAVRGYLQRPFVRVFVSVLHVRVYQWFLITTMEYSARKRDQEQ